ncbi:TonB-dependent receptor [Mitsuaria sp. GD03876]|uniref:TonB-dependent receptor n=1 Tax=Mitsuaria sp. GD03876 TaxID=2975399 RepID=UPI00244AD41D|nr:TonB-dependent receptor [Mitsuaria sp. GD03876]MDH0865036.1 TonB-dependent receptor [Mitsuaria sp. GD03876]
MSATLALASTAIHAQGMEAGRTGAHGAAPSGAARADAAGHGVAGNGVAGDSAAGAGAATALRFDVAAGDLDRAVVAVGATAGLRVLFDPRRLQGLRATALAGTFTPDEALARLLRGSGWRAVFTGPASVRLEPGEAADVPAHRAAVAGDAQASPDPVPDVVLPTVRTRGRSERDARDERYRSAGSLHVLRREDIERSRGTSVGDIFQGLPGVLVGENRNSGGLDINIRGMQGQGRVPVLVDGARQETTVYRGYSGVASRSYVDPDLIGGIQIDKGPVLGAQGAGAVGGLVSMRTLNAEDVVLNGRETGVRVRAQAIGNNSGSPIAPGTPAGLFTGNFSGAAPVYRADCVDPAICVPPMPANWGYPGGLDRPGTFKPTSWAGSIAGALRLASVDLVAAYARREQGNYHAGTHGPSAWVDLSDRRKLPFYTEVRPAIRGASRFQAGERIPGTNFESESALLKAQAYLPDGQELELSVLRYDSRYGEIMPSQIIRFGNFFPVSQPRDSQVAAQTYSGRYRWHPDEHPWLDLRAALWHTRTRATNNSPDESNTAEYTYNNERERYRRTGLELSNTALFTHPAGWGESEARIGLGLQRETVGTTALSANNNTGGRSGDRHEANVFAAWQYRPVDSVTLDAGLRHTRFRAADDRPIVVTDKASPSCVDRDGDGACDPIPNRNRRSGTAPIVSISWEPRVGLQVYSRYAEADRMPSLFESTSGFSFVAKPDVILRPEHAVNKEIGVNLMRDGVLRRSDRLRLKVSHFRNHVKDYLTRTSPNLWESDGQISTNFTLRNIDSVRFEGIEASGGYDAGVGYVEVGATRYTRIQVCHAGSYRVNACNDYGVANSYINNMVPPRWHGSATLGARLLDRRLTVGARATLMGRRTRAPAFNDDTAQGLLPVVPWHGYRVVDLFAGYRASERLSIDLNLDNLTDRYYLDALGLGLIPAPGRTARLSVTLQF